MNSTTLGTQWNLEPDKTAEHASKMMTRKCNSYKVEKLESLNCEISTDQAVFEMLIFKEWKFWKYRYMKGIKKGSQLPSEMYLDDKKATTDENAKLFNVFFFNTFSLNATTYGV